MLRTARLTEAMRAHRKTLAASAAVAGVLAGAGGASAALTSGPTNALGSHAAPSSHHSAFTAASLTSAKKKTKKQAAANQFLPIGQSTPTVTGAPPAQSNAATPTQATAAPAQQAAPAQAAPAPAPAPAQPSTTIYDSVSASSIPSGARAAVYSDGAYAASPGQVAGHPDTLWIDTNGSNTKANVLDVEPGDATPQQAATWVQQKLSANPNDTAIVYTFRAEWGPTQQAIAALPQQMQSHVKWWIADPTGVPHIVPGSDATQWYWGQNYDQSLANPGF